MAKASATGAHTTEEVALLRSEIELLMKERDMLLRVSGAAAVFVANMDVKALPQHAYDAADLLAKMVNVMPEDVLKDALDAVKAEVALDVPERRTKPR